MGLGKRQGIALAMGLTLFFAGWSLKQSNPGLDIGFFPSFTNSTTGELMFWLVVTLMLTPAGALLGYAFAPRLEAPLTALWQRIEQMDLKEKRVGLALVFIVGFSLARATHLLVLQEFPFTDDEWAARFGGQILATGHATMPLPHGYRAMPDLYLFVRSGTVTSFDWLGAQATWAFSFLTGTGAAIFHFFAALGALGVTVVIGKRLSSAWALVAAGLFLFSPMGFLLSASTHTHLQSRGLIAVVLGLLLIAEESKRFGWWAAVGLCTGLSVASRPLETAFSLAPMFLDLIWRARSDRDLRRAIPPFLLGLAVPMVFFCLHMQAVTGSPFLPARFAKNEIVPFGGARTRPPLASFTSLTVFWQRFGQNCSYNFFSLIIFAGGALGAAFAFLGVFRDRYTKLLGWCVVSSLALALVHDNPGIHSAGPMHYSEALVLLVLLSVHGLASAKEFLEAHSLLRFSQVAAVLGAFTVAFLSFDVWHGAALREQARIHVTAYRIPERPELAGKVVLAPRYFEIWRRWYFASQVGTFVFQWRPISPLKDEAAVIVHDVPEAVPGLREDYPDREIVRLSITEAGAFTIQPVAPSLASEAGRQLRNGPQQ